MMVHGRDGYVLSDGGGCAEGGCRDFWLHGVVIETEREREEI